jgi:hypothetical protein
MIVHYTCICTLFIYLIYMHITVYIEKYVLYERFNGYSRVILTRSDSEFRT